MEELNTLSFGYHVSHISEQDCIFSCTTSADSISLIFLQSLVVSRVLSHVLAHLLHEIL